MKFLKVTPCCVLLGLLVGSADASAAIFKVFVDGDFGGQVMVDGDIGAPPAGACGIRWTDPDAWYWGDGNIYGTNEMNIFNNGIDVSELSYTGPYAGCGAGPYVFVTPASPGGWAPPGAVALVVQVGPGDYEWLDAHAEPIPVDPGSPDPGPLGICDEVPEFCEIPETLVNGDMCTIHPSWCDTVKLLSLGSLTVDARSYILDIVELVRAGSRSQLEDHLERPFVGAEPNDLFGRLAPPLDSGDEPEHVDYFAVGIGSDLNLGLRHARACIQAAGELLLQSFWPRSQLEAVYAICGLAGDRYQAADARVQQLVDAEAEAGAPNGLTGR